MYCRHVLRLGIESLCIKISYSRRHVLGLVIAGDMY